MESKGSTFAKVTCDCHVQILQDTQACSKSISCRNYVRNAVKNWTNGLVADVSRRDAVSA